MVLKLNSGNNKVLGFIILLMCVLLSCNKDELRFVGAMLVPENDSLSIRIYQEDKFDSSLALYYEIVNSDSLVLVDKTFFTGTHDKIKNVNEFDIGLSNDVAYLTYFENKVFVMHSLDSGIGYPHGSFGKSKVKERQLRDSLFFIISKDNPYVLAHWK